MQAKIIFSAIKKKKIPFFSYGAGGVVVVVVNLYINIYSVYGNVCFMSFFFIFLFYFGFVFSIKK